MSYTEFRDGYKKETAPGTSIITAVGDSTNVFGAISQESEHPSPVAVTKFTSTGVNTKEVGAGLMWKSHYVIMGMYGLVLQNGVPLWAVMGKSSTAGADPYTHTITPTTDGSPIPSFTLNHEQKGSATNEEYQFMGCKFDSLALVHDMKDAPFLMARIEVRGLGAQDGIALTNDPTLPATANTDPYVELTRTWALGESEKGIQNIYATTPEHHRTQDVGQPHKFNNRDNYNAQMDTFSKRLYQGDGNRPSDKTREEDTRHRRRAHRRGGDNTILYVHRSERQYSRGRLR